MAERVVVHAFDANGKPVEPGSPEAVTGEAIHYDADGNEVRRDYLRNDIPMPTSEDPVADMLTAEPGPWTLALPDGTRVEDLATLITLLGGDQVDPDVMADRISAVVVMPDWENAPAPLQRQVYAYLAG